MTKVADLTSECLFVLGAVVSLEVDTNRLETIVAVEEAADLILCCNYTMKENDIIMHIAGWTRPAIYLHWRGIVGATNEYQTQTYPCDLQHIE